MEGFTALDTETQNYLKETESIAAIVSLIVERRKELGLTQRELAERCALSKSSITRMESFETIPNLDTLLRILQTLHLRLSIVRNNI